MFRDGWIKVNDIPTHVMTWGGWIEDDISSDSILVCIPGNPGITDFYFYFLEKLHSIIKIPVWIMSHVGCEPLPEGMTQPSMDERRDLYELVGQIHHKKTFLEAYVPSDKKLFLIGHSVGGKICVELMKDEKFASKTVQVHLIFPTLEHIGESPNGKIYTGIIQYIIPVFVSLAWIFTALPLPVQHALLSSFFWLRSDWNMCHRETCLLGVRKLFTPLVSKTALVLAKDEIAKIQDFDSEIYDNYHDKLFCYYAQADRWAPLNQYHHLMSKHPKVNGTIMDKNYTHSFVLTAPAGMALELGNKINTALQC